MKAKLLAASLLAAGYAGIASAQDFLTADTDADGFVSLEEAQSADATVTADAFAGYDADGDGQLNEEEFSVWAGDAMEADVEADADADLDIVTEDDAMDAELDTEVDTDLDTEVDASMTYDDGAEDDEAAEAEDVTDPQ